MSFGNSNTEFISKWNKVKNLIEFRICEQLVYIDGESCKIDLVKGILKKCDISGQLMNPIENIPGFNKEAFVFNCHQLGNILLTLIVPLKSNHEKCLNRETKTVLEWQEYINSYDLKPDAKDLLSLLLLKSSEIETLERIKEHPFLSNSSVKYRETKLSKDEVMELNDNLFNQLENFYSGDEIVEAVMESKHNAIYACHAILKCKLLRIKTSNIKQGSHHLKHRISPILNCN